MVNHSVLGKLVWSGDPYEGWRGVIRVPEFAGYFSRTPGDCSPTLATKIMLDVIEASSQTIDLRPLTETPTLPPKFLSFATDLEQLGYTQIGLFTTDVRVEGEDSSVVDQRLIIAGYLHRETNLFAAVVNEKLVNMPSAPPSATNPLNPVTVALAKDGFEFINGSLWNTNGYTTVQFHRFLADGRRFSLLGEKSRRLHDQIIARSKGYSIAPVQASEFKSAFEKIFADDAAKTREQAAAEYADASAKSADLALLSDEALCEVYFYPNEKTPREAGEELRRRGIFPLKVFFYDEAGNEPLDREGMLNHPQIEPTLKHFLTHREATCFRLQDELVKVCGRIAPEGKHIRSRDDLRQSLELRLIELRGPRMTPIEQGGSWPMAFHFRTMLDDEHGLHVEVLDDKIEFADC